MDLKETNPQKYYVKFLFKLLYYFGIGDCWYEPTDRSAMSKRFYLFWAILSNGYIFSNIINEFAAYIRNDLTEREQNDLFLFMFAHGSISAKIIAYYILRDRIKLVFQRLLEDFRSSFNSVDLDKACVKKFKMYCFTLIAVSYSALFSATLDGVRAYLQSGIPIRTEVTFYPRASNSGIFINILRFFFEFHWWYIVAVMAVLDCLAIASLVYVSFKFKLMQIYFKGLKKKLIENEKIMNTKALEYMFRKDFIMGVRMHEHALWCARNVQSAMGSLYSIQVFETVALLVMCLIKFVRTEHNTMFLLANMVFILCMIMITGAYMMPAGDVTYEAGLVSTAIFQSGWEHLTLSTDLRVLLVAAIQQSQVPVFMTAFGILILSYNSLITVLRSSYSFFAVMY